LGKGGRKNKKHLTGINKEEVKPRLGIPVSQTFSYSGKIVRKKAILMLSVLGNQISPVRDKGLITTATTECHREEPR